MKNTWSVNCDSLSKFPSPSSPVGIYHPLAHEGAARPVSQLGEWPALRNHKPEKQEKEGLSLKLTLWWADYKFPELKRPGASPAKPDWRGMSQVTDRTTELQLCRDATRSQGCKSGSGVGPGVVDAGSRPWRIHTHCLLGRSPQIIFLPQIPGLIDLERTPKERKIFFVNFTPIY